MKWQVKEHGSVPVALGAVVCAFLFVGGTSSSLLGRFSPADLSEDKGLVNRVQDLETQLRVIGSGTVRVDDENKAAYVKGSKKLGLTDEVKAVKGNNGQLLIVVQFSEDIARKLNEFTASDIPYSVFFAPADDVGGTTPVMNSQSKSGFSVCFRSVEGAAAGSPIPFGKTIRVAFFIVLMAE